MKKIILIVLLLTATIKMEAQQKTNTAIGEYFLRGVMETASGFKLNADSTFEFFFSYGALDRSGSGTWRIEGNKVVFNSENKKGKSFILLNSSTVANESVTVNILDANPSLRSNVYGFIKAGDKQGEGKTNAKGEMVFPRQEVEQIELILEFCPEKTFVFTNQHRLHNHFEFRFEKDIMEVFFDHLSLTLTEEGMEGQHPLLKNGLYQFKKN